MILITGKPLMKTLISLLSVFAFCSVYGQQEVQTLTIQSQPYKYVFQMSDGRLSGKYTAYYANGKIRSEGNLLNGYHIGVWTLYDENEKELVRRNYDEISHYTSNNSAGGAALKRTENGLIEQTLISTDAIAFSKRLWRVIPLEGNQYLFNALNWLTTIQQWSQQNKLHLYAPDSDEMSTVLPVLSDISKMKLTGIKIKEDYFYDSKRKIGEFRIVAIAPVITGENDIATDLCWIYYPEIRALLGEVKCENETACTVLEDLFYFRRFSGEVIKESNVNNQQVSDYKKGSEIREESLRIQLDLLETEHNYWP